ncbi:uncharacterized protein LOC119598091 [Penaeus monodon]|uniref:uncharacterized protein LOC119598091 n=1 Tax=Penaeus monodon TaxID=6687 RepID=UPI0018A7C43D|nr:uncharacterized protein LOC119598091 [Penaeus monodon]
MKSVKCRQHGITLNAEKFIVAASEASFWGTNYQDMVLKQTREDFDHCNAAPPTDESKKNFCLDSGPHFVKATHTHILQTDASRLYGLGYVLLQDLGAGRYKMVQCGSRFLTDTETRKCKFYLRGLQHFSLMTDHRPLVPILNHYSLDAIENPRFQRMKDKIAPYIFTAMWRAGKELCIPDALSRSPVSHPTVEDGIFNTKVDTSVKIAILHAVKSVQASDAIDEQRISYGRNCSGFPNDRYKLPSTLRPYWKIRNELYNDGDLVLYGPRVVVPASLRRSTLARLYDCHSGVEAMKRRAQQSFGQALMQT